MKRAALGVLCLFCLHAYAVEPLFVRDGVGVKNYPPPPRLAQQMGLVAEAVLPPAETTEPERIQELRDWNAGGGIPAHVGFMRQLPDPIDVQLTGPVASKNGAMPFGRGVAAMTDRGTIVWSTMVQVQGAQRIRLHLEHVAMPADAVFWDYGTTGTPAGFGHELVDSNGNLWAPSVDGDVAYLEVEVPVASLAAAPLSFHIGEVAQIFGVAAAGVVPQDSPTCLIDSTCVSTSTFPGITAARGAVAHIEWPTGPSLIGGCSGALLNDSNGDFIPYFLTANHCFSDANTATSAEFFFDFQSSVCNGTASVQNARSITGAQLLATSSVSDFTFLKLNGAPAGSWFLGWSPNAVPAGTTLYRVSHPVPASTIYPEMFSSTALDVASSTCTGRGRPNYIYSDHGSGGVYGGSSGSPEMLSDGKVVGQLFGQCGPVDPSAGCDSSNQVVDGAFSVTYPSIQQWLSPGSGAQPGVCVPTSTIACILNSRFQVSVRYRNAFDNNPVDTDALLKPVTGFASTGYETAFFYFNSPNNIEMLVKILDQGNTNSQGQATIAVLFGTATPLRIQLTITDMNGGAVKQYTSAYGAMQGATDFTAFVK